jgi:hypothetical protein
MRALVAGNPGLGIGPDWIDECVNQVVRLNFDPYFRCDDPKFGLELKALFIIGAKDGGDRAFWLADEKPMLFALALCCHGIRWLDGLEELRERANCFINKMSKDTPFWQTYPMFGQLPLESRKAADLLVVPKILRLPLLSRVHLLSVADEGTAALMRSTTYPMRSLGVNPLETASALLDSGICEPVVDQDVCARVLSKDDLMAALEEGAVPYQKSWNKKRLLEILASQTPQFLVQTAEHEKTARVKSEFLSELRLLKSDAVQLGQRIKLLCFVNSAI